MIDLASYKSDADLMRRALEGAGVSRWFGPGRHECRCPFHDDKHPSAGFYPSKDGGAVLFCCHGCGFSGSVFEVIGRSRGVSGGEVVRHLLEAGELLGGLHADAPAKPAEKPSPVPYAALAAEAESFRRAALADGKWWLREAADGLGVTVEALDALRCGRNAAVGAQAFPMTDGAGRVCGIRYRWPEGQSPKKSRTGSRAGLFAPETGGSRVLWVVEGPTDAAALLSLGLWAVGIPAARQGIDHLCGYMEIHPPAAVVAVSDDNAAGRSSTTLVAAAASHYAPTVKTIPAPGGHKDVRAFVNARRGTGAAWNAIRRELLAAVAAARPHQRKGEPCAAT